MLSVFYRKFDFLQPHCVNAKLDLMLCLPLVPRPQNCIKLSPSFEKRQRKQHKFRCRPLLLCLDKAVSYIADPRTLLALLSLSKRSSRKLRAAVYKQVLIRLYPKLRLTLQSRTRIWEQLLKKVRWARDSPRIEEGSRNGSNGR